MLVLVSPVAGDHALLRIGHTGLNRASRASPPHAPQLVGAPVPRHGLGRDMERGFGRNDARHRNPKGVVHDGAVHLSPADPAPRPRGVPAPPPPRADGRVDQEAALNDRPRLVHLQRTAKSVEAELVDGWGQVGKDEDAPGVSVEHDVEPAAGRNCRAGHAVIPQWNFAAAHGRHSAGGQRQGAEDVNGGVDDHVPARPRDRVGIHGSGRDERQHHRGRQPVGFLLDPVLEDYVDEAVDGDGAEHGDENPEIVEPEPLVGVGLVDPTLPPPSR